MWAQSFGEEHDQAEFHRRMSPPENEVPVVLPRAVVLARSGDAAVALTCVRVHSTGVSFDLAVRIRPGAASMDDLHQLLWRHGPGAPGLLLGLELADGTRVDNAGRSEPSGDVVFVQGSGSGGDLAVDQSWWLHPLPPAGPIRFVVRCPELGIDETVTELDGGAVARAADEVVTLWPWEPPRHGSPEPPPPPDLPEGSWFAGG